jgi:hypothetical protein
MPTASRHQCLIYEGPPSRNLPALVAVIKQKLQENYRCLYLDSPPIIAGMRSYLAAADVDVVYQIAKSNLVLSSDRSHLTPAGQFDIEGMMSTLKDAIDQALSDGYAGLWATGDMTWEFGFNRDFSKLVEYEWRLEEFIHQNPAIGGICLYHSDTLPREVLRQGLMTHKSLFINQTLSRINPNYVPRHLFVNESVHRADLESTLDELLEFDRSK